MEIENKRADKLLKDLKLAKSRNQAQTMIEKGFIKWNGEIVKKSSQLINEKNLEILKNLEYVGRGALKLEKALEYFNIDIKDKICMDVGASTGGFTQVMLKNGAKKVYAIDVGKDQLDEDIKTNSKVISMEGVNFRYIETNEFSDINFISIDVSFISSKLILPKAMEIISEHGDIVLLLKPQFEMKDALNKNGIIKNKKAHYHILNETISFIEKQNYNVENIVTSPIKGGKGNIEYLVHITEKYKKNNYNIKDIIETAFQ